MGERSLLRESMAEPEKTKKSFIFPLAFVAVFVAINLYLVGSGKIQATWTGLGTIVAAGLTLSLYSFLYEDNPLFTFAEHLYVGVAAAYTFLQVWYPVIVPKVLQPLRVAIASGNELAFLRAFIPGALGVLLFFRFSPRLSFLSHYSFAFIVGFTAGFAVPRYMTNYIFKQVEGTIRPVFLEGALDFSALVVFAGVMSVLFYFFFSLEHKGVWKGPSRLGVFFLMVSFGASFGYTVMARVSLLIGRLTFLLKGWLGVG